MIAIAMDLVKFFPILGDPREENLGYEIWYYNESGCPHPSGYLQERLQNQRRQYSADKGKSKTMTRSKLTGWSSDENGWNIFGFFLRSFNLFNRFFLAFINLTSLILQMRS